MKKPKLLTQIKSHILLLLLLTALPMAAANDRLDRSMLSVANINTSRGLSAARAYSIVETADGAVWIGTRSGVDRYNGQTIKNFRLPSRQPLSNAADCSYRLIRTLSDRLYAYDNHGNIYAYDPRLHTFRQTHDLSITLGGSLPVNEIAIDHNGGVWVATGGGLYRTDKNGKGTWVLRRMAVHHLALFGTDRMIVGTGNGFYIYNVCNDSMSGRLGDGQILSSCYDSHRQQLWLGTFCNGVKVYDLRTHRFAYNASLNSVAHLPVRTIRPLGDGYMLIGIDGAGIYAYDRRTDAVSLLLNTDGKQGEALHGEGIYDICVDSQLNLWVASYTGGVDFVQLTGGRLSFVQNEYLNPQSIMSNTVNDVCQTKDGTLWYATDKGVSIMRRHTQRVSQALRGHVTLTLCPLPDGKMLAGTYGSGVLEIGPDGTSRPVYTQENHTLKTNYVYSVFADSDGALWIGCLNGDLARIGTDSKVNYLPINEVKCIVESPDGQHVAIGTSHGGYLVNRRTLRISRFFRPNEFKDTDCNNFINTLLYTDSSHILIGTDGGGIYAYDLRRRTISNMTAAQGLPSNSVKTLVKDGDRVWISTDRGIAVLNHGRIHDINVADGLERAYRETAATLTDDGNIVFGSVDGAVVLNRSFALGLNYRATLRIAEVDIEGVAADSTFMTRIAEMTDGGHLRLAHSENTVSIEFECINHRYQSDIQYSYLLEGYDRQWSAPSAYPKVRYANLPPGRYTLHVRAMSRSNGRVLDSRTLRIDIAQPWWNSLWAWLVYLCVAAAAVRFAWQYKKERLQQHYNKERIRFFINTAHNIRTPLSLVLAPLDDIAADATLADATRRYVDMARRNGSKLMGMVTELLDFEKSAGSDRSMSMQTVGTNTYLKAQADKFRLVAAEHGIGIHTDSVEPWLGMTADIAILDVVFENLMSNALKYTPQGGTVTLGARLQGGMVELTVSDTGIGIPKAESGKIFSNFFRASNAISSGETGSGLGLSLTRQLAQRMHGSLRFESEEGRGTTFILALPKVEVRAAAVDNGGDGMPTDGQKQTADTAKDTLLFVDDNADLRQYVRMTFGERYNVVDAASGEEALSYLHDGLCDIVVSDVMMPGMSGNELCRRIKSDSQLSWLPVILLTARAGRDFMIEGLNLGADDFVAKPFDSAVLASKIESLLANRRRLADYYMRRSLCIVSGGDSRQECTKEESAAPEERTDRDEKELPEKKESKEEESREGEEIEKQESQEIEKQEGQEIENGRDGQAAETNSADTEFVDRATRIVIEHIADPDFSIDMLCREMAMSRTLFYGRLKTLTGKAPQDFIRLLRLEQAAVWLRRGDTVLDVSVKTGFANVKYFSTVFKKHFGVPPSKYNAE